MGLILIDSNCSLFGTLAIAFILDVRQKALEMPIFAKVPGRSTIVYILHFHEKLAIDNRKFALHVSEFIKSAIDSNNFDMTRDAIENICQALVHGVATMTFVRKQWLSGLQWHLLFSSNARNH